MTRQRSRRAFLAATAATLSAGVAGCSAEPPVGTDWTRTPPAAGDRQVSPTGPTDEDADGGGDAGTIYTEVYRETVGSVGLVRVYDESGPVSQGSGFVNRGDHVVTNHHVVEGGTAFEVQFEDGTWSNARLVGSDAYSDLAVLALDDRPDDATPLTFVRREPPIGTRVVVLGAPFGLGQSVSAGIVSGLDRSLPSETGFRIADAVQTDAAVNPGNSGGPLVDLDGDVVGVINSGGGDNIGFAISAGLCRRVVPALLARGEYDHAYMGVRLIDVSPLVARAMGLARARGVLVVEVVDGQPSEGVLRGSPDTETIRGTEVPVGGDVILSMDGTPTPTMAALSEFLAIQARPGETIPVTVIRDGEETTVDLTLGERPPPDT